MSHTPGYRALRKGRVSLPGQIYLLTTTTLNRRPWFADALLARAACQCMVDPSGWRHSRLLCWVLMPDHWHGLVQLDGDDDLPAVMNGWKSKATRNMRYFGHAGPVWARGFHDRALRRDEDVITAARYIVANPLRAGLVPSVLDYPYWDSVWFKP